MASKKDYVDAANAVKTELEDIKLRAESADPISIRQRNYELRAVARVTRCGTSDATFG